MIDKKYIAIEGAIGVGKTTLAKKISDTVKCKTLFEDYVTNPFLKDFYDNNQLNSFSTQIHFRSATSMINLYAAFLSVALHRAALPTMRVPRAPVCVHKAPYRKPLPSPSLPLLFCVCGLSCCESTASEPSRSTPLS